MRARHRTLEITGILIVVAAFVVYYLHSIRVNPPENAAVARDLAVIMAIPAVLWAAAVLMLVRYWWKSAGARMSTMDPAERLLAASVAALPAHRRDWGAAMLTELREVPGTWARWRFALSCVRVAVVSPPAAGWPVTAMVAGVVVAAVAGARQIIIATVPALDVFAVTFVALVGLLAVLGAARTRRLRLRTPVPIVVMAGGVVAAIVSTTMFLLHYPSAAANMTTGAAVFLAVVLAAGLWLSLAPPRSLTDQLLPAHLGILVALVCGGVMILMMRLDGGVAMGMMLMMMGLPIFPAVGFISAAAGRTFRAGVHAVAWAVLGTSILIYAGWLPMAQRVYDSTSGMLLDGDGGIPVGVNLENALYWAFVMLPMIAIPCGVIGAGFGAWFRRKMSQYSTS